MASKTPLWCYILREAQVQTEGASLGVVGSRIIAETIVGLLKKDPNSFLSQYGIGRNITKLGIEVPTANGRVTVGSMEGLLFVAGLYNAGGARVSDATSRNRLGEPVESPAPPREARKPAGRTPRSRKTRRGR
jgi:hypothetical protein